MEYKDDCYTPVVILNSPMTMKTVILNYAVTKDLFHVTNWFYDFTLIKTSCFIKRSNAHKIAEMLPVL